MEPIFTFSDVQNGADLRLALWEERRCLEFHPQQESHRSDGSEQPISLMSPSLTSAGSLEGLTLTGTPEIWGGMAGGG